MKTVLKTITVGPFHHFTLRAIHKREISVTEWRNRHAVLKADDPSDDDGEQSGSGSESADDNEERTPGDDKNKPKKGKK